MTQFFTKLASAITALALVASFMPTTLFAQEAGEGEPAPETVAGLETTTETPAETPTIPEIVEEAVQAVTETVANLFSTEEEAVELFAGNTFHVDATNTSGNENGSEAQPYDTLQDAISAAAAGDIIVVHGTLAMTSTVNVNKAVTIQGVAGAEIVTSGGNPILSLTAAGATIENIAVRKTDVASQNIIGIQADNVTVRGVAFTGQYSLATNIEGGRATVVSPGVQNFTLANNTITNLRQPSYISKSTGTISGNTVSGTRGWVVHSDSNVNFTGNSWGTNAVDIVFIPAESVSSVPQDNYGDVLAISTANNNAVVLNKSNGGAPMQSHAFVNSASGQDTNDGGSVEPLKTLQSAVARVVAGGTISVLAGTYTGDITLSKAVSVTGPATGEATLTGQILVTASDTTVRGLTITNPSWNGVTVKGIHVYGGGTVISNITIEDNIVRNIANANTKGSYGIMVQGTVDGVRVAGNTVTDISSAGWAHGIEVTPTGTNPVVPQNVVIEENIISNISNASGLDQFGFSVDSSSGIFADASEVTFFRNSLSTTTTVRNLDDASLDVSGNYWGSAAGPAEGQVTGATTITNWYVDAGLTTLNTDEETNSSSGRSGGSRRVTTTTTGTIDGGTTGGQVLGASTYNFTMDLTIGSRGADVSALQQMLIDAGLLAIPAPTGYFGELTRAALAKWQAAHGVAPAAGYFGPITRAAILAAAPTMSAEQRAALIADLLKQVAELQAKLAEMMEDEA